MWRQAPYLLVVWALAGGLYIATASWVGVSGETPQDRGQSTVKLGGLLGPDSRLLGLRLGMSEANFRTALPESEFSYSIPEIYCYGRTLTAAHPERGRALWQAGPVSLEGRFHREANELRLHWLQISGPTDFQVEDFAALEAALTRRYGPHDRLLLPAKMEAARLMVGFAWSRFPGHRLTYRVHGDTHHGSVGLYQTFTETDWAETSQDAPSPNRRAAAEAQRKIYQSLKDRCVAAQSAPS